MLRGEVHGKTLLTVDSFGLVQWTVDVFIVHLETEGSLRNSAPQRHMAAYKTWKSQAWGTFFLFFWSNPTTAHRLGDPSQRLVGSGAGAKLAGQPTTSRTLTTGQGGLIYYHNTHWGASPGIDVFTYSTTR